MTEHKMETLSQLLSRTINTGAPIYNQRRHKECFELYLDTAEYALSQDALAKSNVGQLLQQAIEEATPLGIKQDYAEGAWVLRRCFDTILDRTADGGKHNRLAILDFENLSPNKSSGGSVSSDGYGYWQDEIVNNTTDLEKGQCIADIAYILRASLNPQEQKRFGKSYQNAFPATEVVELLTSLGLAGNRKMAEAKATMLLEAGLLVSMSHKDETKFVDGTHVYRFPTRQEMQSKLKRIRASGQDEREGSDASIYRIALESALEIPDQDTDERKVFAGVSSKHLKPLRSSSNWYSPEQLAAYSLAQLITKLHSIVAIDSRRYRFKTYEECFVGDEAVTALLQNKLATDRQDATKQLNDALLAGLIHHVNRDHLFEDKRLFYRFTSVGDLKKGLDAIASLPEPPASGQERIRHLAMTHRYKQFASLNITEILNAFYGCEDKSGWDIVDLQNWRNNMKRWGFGRREDQDDEMVDRLSPLVSNIDPDTWDVSGDEEWESPYGILAQIAIFDQIPRSAFRGTADAFKWDELAIRATKVAIEKGYFHTAYKSTLNQFLILLPLEHSESWEDQKLGCQLLLQLLSTVAIQDEGLSDYDIVKRLEFSKRLTTAFLEHAQVVAKFKRYPHRNRAKGRTTTLEERIWLASDLVPRWAKSQNPEDARNVVQLPVIPLKRLTKR